MKLVNRVIIVAVLFLLLGAVSALAQQSAITVSVTNGKQALTDAIVERELDLAGAAKALGLKAPVDPSAVRVVEAGGSGNLVSQVDKGEGGKYAVCWQIPGELAAGQTRKFSIILNGGGEVPKPKSAVSVESKGDDVVVTSGRTTLTYSKGIGGMLRTMTVSGVSSSFTWADKIYDGTVYYLATHSASKMSIPASGPLRVVYQAEGEYLDEGKTASSRPRATYRFTHYAGEPAARLETRVTQDFSHSWISFHVVEIHFEGTAIDSYVTDKSGGVLKKSGQSAAGNRWAAVFGPGVFLGVISGGPFIYDGGGQYYGAYNCASVQPLSQTNFSSRVALYFGTSNSEVPAINDWSAAYYDAPVLTVSLETLEKTAKAVRRAVELRTSKLHSLKGVDWIAAYARITVARSKYLSGAALLASGDFGAARESLKQAQTLLSGKGPKLSARVSKGLVSGSVDGYQFIANSHAAYLFSRSADGLGLISIYDRAKKREFLAPDISRAPLWQIAVRQNGSGMAVTNLNAGKGLVSRSDTGLEFVWKGELETHVRVSLPADSPRLRMRLSSTVRRQGLGIQSVTFPDVAGVLPISEGGRDDLMLDTWSIGDLKPSPLVSGSSLRLEYPACMQFMAIYAGGTGIYAAEEDPQANVKSFSWDVSPDSGSLSYSVSHPVLGWGGNDPVTSYTSPGDVVIGPFKGDWYDACQIYRKWALTAPWTAKGPMHKRADYPKWLADMPYWTIADYGDETGLEREIKKLEYFGLPVGASHVYGYYFPLHQDDRYPEYTPPKLGSAGLRNAVKDMHKRGMRSVPYINGWVWDQDTESYFAEDARNKSAMKTKDGGEIVMDSYGHGQKLVGMCPGAPAWQQKMVDVSKDLVGRYDFDGIYYDFLTIHTTDCFNPAHGHPIAGGNFWTSSVRRLYADCRRELKKLRPDAMMTAEDNSEYVIDLLDSGLSLGKGHSQAPLFNAVYHGYTLLFGGGSMTGSDPCLQGRWWLTGNQNGWAGADGAYPFTTDEKLKRDGEYYKRLLYCHYNFARPYLAYGTMLRPPRVTGDMPTVSGESSYRKFTFPVIDGTAWKAPDGSVGVFFLNYGENAQKFSWSVDLAQYAGWGKGARVRLSRWTEDNKVTQIATVSGGKLTREDALDGRGILALKLEVTK